LTEACKPPEGGMNRTADVPVPFVATAIPRPFATDCGELHVCAAATPDPTATQLTTSIAANFEYVPILRIEALL
jgi:hypothetical protein